MGAFNKQQQALRALPIVLACLLPAVLAVCTSMKPVAIRRAPIAAVPDKLCHS